jgi:hypothetical protein
MPRMIVRRSSYGGMKRSPRCKSDTVVTSLRRTKYLPILQFCLVIVVDGAVMMVGKRAQVVKGRIQDEWLSHI